MHCSEIHPPMDALNGLVNVALQQKQPAKALQIVQHQISLVPNRSNFYVLLGQVELRNQDSAKAEEAFQKAVDLDKNNSNAFLFLSSVQVSRGSVDQAIASYRTPCNPIHAMYGFTLLSAACLKRATNGRRLKTFTRRRCRFSRITLSLRTISRT